MLKRGWHDREGNWLDTRADMRAKDDREGRKRMPHKPMEAYIMLQAADNLLRAYTQDLEIFARFAKVWPMLRCAGGMLHKAVGMIADKVSTEQVISLQRTYKNTIINVSSSAVPECVNIHEDDMARLITCARGGLHDGHGDFHSCRDCLCCMSRDEWQNCELYHLLNAMPVSVAENMDTDDPGVCPYGWGGGV